ncbi:MAG: outer membrane beta-barrel protein [Gemmatimonadota bacterium]
MRTLPVTALAIALATQAVPAQSFRRIDAAPVIGGALFVRQLPDSFQVTSANNQTKILRGVGLNDALVIGGHLNLWLSPALSVEASGLFMPSQLHGDAGTTSVDVSAFTLGGRFVTAEGRRVRPYLAIGAGAKRYDFSGDVTGYATHFAFSGGAGVMSVLAEEIHLRADLRDCVSVFTSETGAASRIQHDLILSVGIDLAVWRRRTNTSLR